MFPRTSGAPCAHGRSPGAFGSIRRACCCWKSDAAPRRFSTLIRTKERPIRMAFSGNRLTAGFALLFAFVLAAGTPRASAQKPAEAPVYRNPILFADYSDPDVIRVRNDYYLVASTFHFVPGIPILHSKDLVHWSISGHVIDRLSISPAYDMQGGLRYGRGVWAPAVRVHGGLFYVYFPTPDEGVFVSTAPKMTGPWSAPEAVLPGPGYEDPCPFWDDDGQAYLVHSKVGAGPLILHRMSADGKKVLDEGKEIV